MSSPIYATLMMNLTGMSDEQLLKRVLDTKLRHPSWDILPWNFEEICFIDCNYEMTPDEYGSNKLRFSDYHVKVWDWPAYLANRVARTRGYNSKPLDEPLDHWGQEIVKKCRQDFCSYQILKGLGYK